MKRIMQILCILFITSPLHSYGAQPMDVLKQAVDEVLTILADPAYQDPSGADEQQEKLWKIIHDVFDFHEMSRSTAGRHWKRFSESQKKEFTDVFGRFLADNYLHKIRSGFKGEKVAYIEQYMVTDTKAVVKTEIKRENGDIPVDYSMILLDGAWRVYDVKIEGVSLVKNYRSQFHSILMDESPDRLIEMLKEKLAGEKSSG
jgi:phospholipid transport system substrate-binding protein